MLTKTIDGLFIGTRYLVWVLGILGIVGSVILAAANISLGMSSVFVFIGTLLLSITLSLLLMPDALVKQKILPEALMSKRFVISAVSAVLAAAVVGIIYFTNGGFPSLNLLFI